MVVPPARQPLVSSVREGVPSSREMPPICTRRATASLGALKGSAEWGAVGRVTAVLAGDA